MKTKLIKKGQNGLFKGIQWATNSEPAIMTAAGYEITPKGKVTHDFHRKGAPTLRNNLTRLATVANTIGGVGAYKFNPNDVTNEVHASYTIPLTNFLTFAGTPNKKLKENAKSGKRSTFEIYRTAFLDPFGLFLKEREKK